MFEMLLIICRDNTIYYQYIYKLTYSQFYTYNQQEYFAFAYSKVNLEVIFMERDKVGDRIRQERKRLKLTQEQLAVEIPISESYLALIETGKRTMSVDILEKLADKFGVTADYLLMREETDIDGERTRKWLQMVKGRNDIEIETALELLSQFWSSLDRVKESR